MGLGLLATALVARHALTGAGARLRELHPLPLGFAAAALIVTLAASAGAWRCALGSAGVQLHFREAWGCYGLGSLANAVLPARCGEAVRIGLFARRVDRSDRHRVSGAACVAVGGVRAVVYGATCAGAAAAGLLPGWALVVPLAAVGLAAGALCLFRRRLPRLALVGMVTGTGGAALMAWAMLAAAARLAGGIGVLAALDVPRPVACAIVGLGALAVASVVPIAPGAAGVAGASMTLALEQSGVAAPTAVAAAVAFHAVETLASVVFGSAGWVALRTIGRFTDGVARVETSCEVSALPWQGSATVCPPCRRGARRAPRRRGHPVGVRAAHLPARAWRGSTVLAVLLEHGHAVERDQAITHPPLVRLGARHRPRSDE